VLGKQSSFLYILKGLKIYLLNSPPPAGGRLGYLIYAKQKSPHASAGGFFLKSINFKKMELICTAPIPLALNIESHHFPPVELPLSLIVADQTVYLRQLLSCAPTTTSSFIVAAD